MIFDQGIFDSDLLDGEQFLHYYSIDAIIQAISVPASYELDATLVQSSYHRYQVDALIAMERSDTRFRESIINAIIHSYARACEELSETISLMGLRLQLPYATSDDLDQYWSKILGLRRRYQESDEDFRARLATRLSIMKSSGTKPECEAIIDSILSMKNASEIRTYWPAEVRVNWRSFQAMIRAEERYAAVREALDSMLATGVSWSTSFPYKAYPVDANLMGRHSTSYLLDLGISRQKLSLYLVRTDIFDTRSTLADLDALIETAHQTSEPLDLLLKATRSSIVQLDANISETHERSYQLDVILRQRKYASYETDALAEIQRELRFYKVDAFAQRSRSGAYLVTVDVSA